MNIDKRTKMIFMAVTAALLLIYIAPIGSYPLMEPDEGRYAEIPREMLESGDYITPKLNYVKYFEKPALLYWVNAVNFKIFGQNEFAARIFPVASALLCALVTGLLASFMYGSLAGWMASIISLTSFLYFAIGTLNITDMPLTFFLTLAFAAFYYAQSRDDKRGYLVFYAACALAVLTKGLIGVVLPGAVIFSYILASKKWRLFYKPLYLSGIAIFFMITVPWFYLVCRTNPDFFHFFFIREHFLRYLTKIHDRYKPFWFFIPFIITGLLPWTAFLFGLGAKESVLRSPDMKQKDANIYNLLWAGVIFLFFSFADSKLIPYIIPCFPPLCIILAADLSKMAEDGKQHGMVTLALVLTCGLSGMALAVYPFTGGYVTIGQVLWILLRSVPALIAMPVIAYFTFRENKNILRGICGFLICSVLFLWGIRGVYGIIAPTRSMKYAAASVLAVYKEGDTVVAYDENLPGLSFYAQKRTLTVGSKGELEFGLERKEGEGWFLPKEKFIEEWNHGKKSYIIVMRNGGVFDEFVEKADLTKAKIVNCDGKYFVIYR